MSSLDNENSNELLFLCRKHNKKQENEKKEIELLKLICNKNLTFKDDSVTITLYYLISL